MKLHATLLAATALAVSAGTASAEKWDMPMAYAATNFHSEVGANFAACVTEGTGGDLEVVTHPSGSLFPERNPLMRSNTSDLPASLCSLPSCASAWSITVIAQCFS